MSHIRLYLDEDAMRTALVFGLRARSIDVLTASEVGMVNRADAEHLARASSHGRALYSFNVADYCVIHQEHLTHGRQHCGIILAQQQRYTLGEELRRLTRLVSSVPAEQMRNQIQFLSSWG